MKRLLIVGVGSPFGDDTLGWQVLDALPEGELRRPGWDLRLAKADRPGTALLDLLAASDSAVLIDALLTDEPPGTVRLLEPGELALLGAPYSSHALGVAEVLALGERLDMLPPELWIIGITPGRRDPAAVTALLQRLLPGRPISSVPGS